MARQVEEDGKEFSSSSSQLENSTGQEKGQLKGLSKYYRALLGGGKTKDKRRAKKKSESETTTTPKQDKKRAVIASDYIQSSASLSSSSSASSAGSSVASSACPSSDEEDETCGLSGEQLDNKNLVRVAKRCSRIYDELERILAQRAASERLRREIKNDKRQQRRRREKDENGNKGNEEEEDNNNLLQSPQKRSSSTTLNCDELTYDDELDNEEDELSVATTNTERDDQISLSSSSLSSESIPEIKQRQNLQKLYHVVNEIHSSEAKFVDTLRLLNEDFRQYALSPSSSTSSSSVSSSSASSSSSQQQAISDCLNSMLKHLPQLQALNENLLEELRLARDQWPRTQKIAHVLVKIGPFLKHYSSYIREFEQMQHQFNDNIRKYPQFGERVREFEASERAQKLTIQHHLLKPIQRIPQYRLLLQQYLHHLKPDDNDYEDTVNALEVVSRVAEHANHSMSEGANFAKLLAIQAKIVGRQRNIIQPGRLFVKEGELLKVCRKQTKPRWFVLLNDALLYLTQIQSSDILYLNNELPLDDCHVSTPSESEQQQQQTGAAGGQQFEAAEFSVWTRTRSFSLIASSIAERDEWLQVFKRTIDEHLARRRSFSVRQAQAAENADEAMKGALAGASAPDPSNHNLTSNFSGLLGHKAPIWTPDSRVTMCQLCTSSFSALFRRHHCRACGRVVCSACSSNKAPLVYKKCRTARVCDQCYEQLKANIHLYYLPTTGANNRRQSLRDESELRRLDEHFRTLLKSQFKRQTKALRFNTNNNNCDHHKK